MMRFNCCSYCCKGLVALTVVAGMMVTLAGCSDARDAEPRKTAQDSSYKNGKMQGQQWNPSDGSGGTMSEPRK